MSTSDVSRSLHQPLKQYSGARLEAGRPLLDADFNEGAALREEERRAFLLDLIGGSGSPDEGFSPGRALPTRSPPEQSASLREGTSLPVQSVTVGDSSRFVHAVSLRAGSLYVAGRRVELRQATHFAMQPEFLQMRGSDLPELNPLAPASPESPGRRASSQVLGRGASPRRYFLSPGRVVNSPRSPLSPSSPNPAVFPLFSNFYYLTTWEQEVSAAEDEEIREVALGGADASKRVRRMQRAQVLGQLPPHIRTCDEAWAELGRRMEAENASLNLQTGELKSRGRLQLTFPQERQVDCPECEISPSARYLGSENVTLRFLLTRPDRFVWGTENGSTLYRVEVTGLSAGGRKDVVVKMLTPPQDVEHQPQRHRVVEILPFAAILEGAELLEKQDPHFQKVAAEVGAFARVSVGYNSATKSFSLEAGEGTRQMAQFVVRWDKRHPAAHQLNHSDPAGSDARYFFMRMWHVAESPGLTEIPISQSAPLADLGIVPVFHHPGRRGDFWTASFRVDRPDRCVPFDLLTQEGGVAPHGPGHALAPLFLLQGEDQVVDRVSDCRRRIRRATDTSCATRSVGDGLISFGDFSNIQAAIDSLPREGGLVEIRPGVHLGPVSIRGRQNVSLVGCGQATIRSVFPESGDALISVSHSQGVRLVDLRLQAAGQRAVAIQESRGLQLRELTVESGSFQAGEFVPGDHEAQLHMIELRECALADLEQLTLFPGRQGGLLLDETQQVVVRGMNLTTEAASSAPPAFPAVSLNQARSVRVADSRLHAVGQLGVSLVDSDEVALRNLVIECAAHQSLEEQESSPPLPAIYASSVERLDVLQCRILLDNSASEHAGISLQGRELTLEESFIEVAPSSWNTDYVWGGVEIRGGSSGVILRNNHIAGGYGHGVTLGSVASTGLRGPGEGLTEIVSGVPRVHGDLRRESPSPGTTPAQSAGPLEKITLSGNTIERMGTNGISVPTVLGLEPEQEWFRVTQLVLERNVLRNNVRQPFAGMKVDTGLLPFSTSAQSPVDLSIQVLPRGGVVLALVEEGAALRGNEVTGHVPDQIAQLGGVSIPICGIFVLIGDSLSIVDNRIVGNGEELRPKTGIPEGIERGVRAGIAVMLAGSGTAMLSQGEASSSPSFVRSPEDVDMILQDASALDSTQRALVVSRNSVRQPEGRALHVVGTGSISIDSNFLSSRGNLRGVAFTERTMVGDVIFVLDLGRPWETSLHPVDKNIPFGPQQPSKDEWLNDFKDYLQNTKSPRQFLSLGGALSFCNNQVLYDWARPASTPEIDPPLSTFASAFFSLDHVTVSANQFVMRLQGHGWSYEPDSPLEIKETFLADVFALGGTVEAVQNRVSSRVGNVFSSLACCASMGSVMAYNQTTHHAVSYRTSEPVMYLSYGQRLVRLEVSNQVLFMRERRGQASEAEFQRDFRDLLKTFSRIVLKNI